MANTHYHHTKIALLRLAFKHYHFHKVGFHNLFTCHCGLNFQTQNYYHTNLGFSSHITSESGVGDNFLFVDDILEESDSTPQVHVFDGIGSLSGVLKVNSQVRTLCLSR